MALGLLNPQILDLGSHLSMFLVYHTTFMSILFMFLFAFPLHLSRIHVRVSEAIQQAWHTQPTSYLTTQPEELLRILPVNWQLDVQLTLPKGRGHAEQLWPSPARGPANLLQGLYLRLLGRQQNPASPHPSAPGQCSDTHMEPVGQRWGSAARSTPVSARSNDALEL